MLLMSGNDPLDFHELSISSYVVEIVSQPAFLPLSMIRI